MNIERSWNKAIRNTEVIRSRVKSLSTFKDTQVPYVLLAESSINTGDTVVRQGEVLVQKPSLILPPNNPQFDGFEFDEDTAAQKDDLINFLLVRGVMLPSMHYNNKTHSLEVYEGKLSKAVKDYQQRLQHQENVSAGLIVGPEDCWQLSLLIFIYSQVAKNAEADIRKLLDEYRKNGGR